MKVRHQSHQEIHNTYKFYKISKATWFFQYHWASSEQTIW